MRSDRFRSTARSIGTSSAICARREITPPETFQLAGIVSDGSVSYCPAGDGPPCVLPVAGTITFETYELDGPASGSFVIDLGDELIEGDFDAERCEPASPIRCG